MDKPTVKAVTDGEAWVLDILAAPFGSPVKRDAHNEYFDLQTDFAAQHYPLAPLVYYHGFDAAGRKAPRPIFLGNTFQRDVRVDGVWYKGRLDQAVPLASQMWDAARDGHLAASPGTADHLRRAASDGHLDVWPILEISIFETTSGKRPASPYAVALPALKAVYAEAGMNLPPEIEEAPMAVGAANTAQHGASNGLVTLSTADLQQVAAAVKAALEEQQTAHAVAAQAMDLATHAHPHDRDGCTFAKLPAPSRLFDIKIIRITGFLRQRT